VVAPNTVHFSIYVIVVPHDGGGHKRPKHVAADEWMSKSVMFVMIRFSQNCCVALYIVFRIVLCIVCV